MIYTVTLNPSIDHIIYIDKFSTGSINRVKKRLTLSGGKGINVSMVLKNLGYDSTAFGFIGGYTGSTVKDKLDEWHIDNKLIRVKDNTRINIKIMSDTETQCNESGPIVEEKDIIKLLNLIDQIDENSFLVLSGSAPLMVRDDIYRRIMERNVGKNIKVIIDARNEMVLKSLPLNPFLIKPNRIELEEIFGESCIEEKDIQIMALKLQKMGAKNVLVSLDGDGAYLLDEYGQSHKLKAPLGVVSNTIGAGDSMVAGFIAGYIESDGSYEAALRKGVATGSASVFSERLATKEEVERLLKEMS